MFCYTVVRRGGTPAETGCALAHLGEALRYKPEGHGFDSGWYHMVFYLRTPSGRALAPAVPLTEMGTRNISWGKDGRRRLF